MKRFLLTLLLLTFTAGFLGACHTVAGAKEDVKQAAAEVDEHTDGK